VGRVLFHSVSSSCSLSLSLTFSLSLSLCNWFPKSLYSAASCLLMYRCVCLRKLFAFIHESFSGQQQFGPGAAFDGEMCACRDGYVVRDGMCRRAAAGAAASGEDVPRGKRGRGGGRGGNGAGKGGAGAGGKAAGSGRREGRREGRAAAAASEAGAAGGREGRRDAGRAGRSDRCGDAGFRAQTAGCERAPAARSSDGSVGQSRTLRSC
jgi:hypothetical protein